jgi:hypothetical protein
LHVGCRSDCAGHGLDRLGGDEGRARSVPAGARSLAAAAPTNDVSDAATRAGERPGMGALKGFRRQEARELCATSIIDIGSRVLTGPPADVAACRQQWSGVMSILISILITFLVVILVLYLINLLPLEGRAKQIVQAIVIIIGVLSLLRYLAVF